MDIIIDRPTRFNEIINCKTFGVNIDNADNTDALQKAFDYAAQHAGTRLVIDEKGVYRFSSEKRLVIHDATDIELDGGGAEFLFSAKSYFDILNCTRAVLRNIYMDWDWDGTYRLADMLKVSGTGAGYVDFTHTEVARAQDKPWMTINQYDADTLTPGCEGGKEFWAMTDKIRVEHIADNVSRVHHEGLLDELSCDEVYCLRYETYGTNAVVLSNSHHVTVENVTVWSTPGMAFIIGGGSSHYNFDNCTVGLRPGKNRRMSATADSMHIGNSCGYGIVENCDFAWAGDDAINIHDNVGLVNDVRGTHTVVVQKRLNCNVGDVVGLMRDDAYNTGFTTTITQKTEHSKTEWLLEFEDTLPPEAVVGSIFFNQKFNSAYYIFRNNYFHENRARGLLLGSSHGLVENNTLYKTQGAAILTVVDIAPNWSEGTGVEDLVVRNNKFIECNVNDWTPMINIRTMLPQHEKNYDYKRSPIETEDDGVSDAPVFKGLVFEGNLFENMPSTAISVRSASDVRVTGNTIVITSPRKSEKKNRGGIEVSHSSGVVAERNIRIDTRK